MSVILEVEINPKNRRLNLSQSTTVVRAVDGHFVAQSPCCRHKAGTWKAAMSWVLAQQLVQVFGSDIVDAVKRLDDRGEFTR